MDADPVMRAMFTTRRLFVVILLTGLFTLAARGIADPDFWWHLRTGQYIVQTHSVPHQDIYSFTNYGRPWIAHEWLSEVLIYSLYRLAGWAGLMASFAAVTTASFWLAYRRCTPDSRPYLAGVATLVAAIATIPFWGVRPQILSLLLTSAFLYLLGRYRASGNELYLWSLVPLTVLWVNLHGGYVLGLTHTDIAWLGPRTPLGAPGFWLAAIASLALASSLVTAYFLRVSRAAESN